MTGRVFISHSSADKPAARQLATDLRNRGIEVWIDEENIQAGSSIPSAIFEGIDSSDYFVLLISGKSVQSRWVHHELEIAIQKSVENKFVIIPIRLDGTRVPKLVKNLHYLDFRTSRSAGFESLIAFLKQDDRLVSDRRRSARSEPDERSPSTDCVTCLKLISAKQLREKILQRYNHDEVAVIWYDLFNTRIDDDVPNKPLPNSIIELIDRAKRKGKFEELLGRLCAEHPYICP